MLTDRPRPDGAPARPGAGATPGPPAGGTRPAAYRPGAPRPQGDGPATLALTLLTLASLAGLYRLYDSAAWAGPVLVTAAAAHGALWLLRRYRVPVAAAVPAALAVVVMAVVWTGFGYATAYGFPGPAVWHHVWAAVTNLSNDIATTVAPVPVTKGFAVVSAAAGGVVAVISDSVAFRWRQPLAAVIPAVAAFVFASAAGQGGGRTAVVALEVAAVAGFLLVERAAAVHRQVWFAGVRTGAVARTVGPGIAAAAAAVLVAIAVSPAVGGRDGTGVLGWRVGNGSGGGGERIVPNPLVKLQTELLHLSSTPVFVVSSPVPSYWRLTSLDNFDGSTWTASGSYSGFGNRLPGVPAAQPGVRTVTATFTIQDLDSVWLPEQFNPVEVRGTKRVSFDPSSDSLLTAVPTFQGQTYTVTSYQLLDDLSASVLRRAPAVSDPRYTALTNVDSAVQALAQQITAGRTDAYDKAMALQDYLRSDLFTYTLTPPADGSGTSSLDAFLFRDRKGYCQQFAGAFAVLARSVGLPTRLAVGFATGQPVGDGSYQVHGSDAHTWPEVYFGARYGWVPFEPTRGFDVPGSEHYANSGTRPGGVAPTPTPTTTVEPAINTVPVVKPGVTAPKGASGTTVAPAAGPAGQGPASAWWLVFPGLVAAVVAWGGVNVGGRDVLRRFRRRRAARTGPAAEVALRWRELNAALAWWGLTAGPSETDDEFAARSQAALARRGVGGPWRAGGPAALAALVRRAAFATDLPADAVARADAAGHEVGRALWRATPWPSRLTRALALPPGTSARVSAWLHSTSRPAGGPEVRI